VWLAAAAAAGPFRSAAAAAVFNSPYWRLMDAPRGHVLVTWLLSQCHPYTHTHTHTHTHRDPLRGLGRPHAFPPTHLLITVFSRGGGQLILAALWEKLGICLRSHFCNSSPVSRESRLALPMPRTPLTPPHPTLPPSPTPSISHTLSIPFPPLISNDVSEAECDVCLPGGTLGCRKHVIDTSMLINIYIYSVYIWIYLYLYKNVKIKEYI